MKKEKYQITILSGDGIGPEITEQAVKTLNSVAHRFGHRFEMDFADFGAISIDKYGTPFTETTKERCLRSDAVLLAAIVIPNMITIPRLKFGQNKVCCN
jgi:3-isopropylmalate dehydrogenase